MKKQSHRWKAAGKNAFYLMCHLRILQNPLFGTGFYAREKVLPERKKPTGSIWCYYSVPSVGRNAVMPDFSPIKSASRMGVWEQQ
jgi:hypothetical protein